MRKFFSLMLALIILLPLMGETEISGRIKMFSSLFLSDNVNGQFFSHESGEFAFKRIELRFQLQGDISEKVSYGARLDTFSSPDAIFSTGNSGYSIYQWSFPEAGSLGSPEKTEPFEINLYEAYIKVSDFLIKNLDLTVGKQRISWGTADKVNVIDNLNPVDFANFLTFDPDYFNERRPQAAFNFEYYIGNQTKLQAVWLISRQYSPLPQGFSYLMAGQRGFYYSVRKEKNTLNNTNFGLRASTVVLNTDVALSWYHGNFHFPVLYGLGPVVFYGDSSISEQQLFFVPTGDTVPVTGYEMYFSYPALDVVGLSFSGEIASVGFWGEIGYYMPEKTEGFLNMGMGPTLSFDLFEKGYFKYVIGADYTIGVGNGVYLNAQFVHGFFDERDYSKEAERLLNLQRGQFFGEIENYIIARAEYKMLGDNLKLSLGGFVEMGEGTSYAFMPSVELRVKDALTIEAGAFSVSGDRNTKFGSFNDDKICFVALKLDF